MKRITSLAAVIALVTASLLLATSTATAYQQSSPSATLLTFPSGLTVAVTGANTGSSTITLTPENTTELGGVTTYDPLTTTSTGVHYLIENPVIQNDVDVDAGSVTFAFSHPVVNPRIHIVRAGGINANAGTFTASNSFALADGSWEALTGFTNYVTSATEVTAPDGPVNYSGSSTRCVPAAAPGSVPFACGTVRLDGTVSTATVDISYFRVVSLAPDPGGIYAGQGGFSITVDESLGGTATGDVPLPASYGASSSVVTDLRLGSGVSTDQQTTLTGGAPVFQAQKAGVDGVATLPVLNPGESSTFTAAISGASKAAFAYAWIDVNRDGIYGAGERVPGVIAGGTATFAVPQTLMASAVAGSTFMRVRTGYTDAQAGAPTGFSDSGESEDYAVEVLAPTAPVITGPASGSATSDTTPTFTGTGDDGDTITVTGDDGTVLCTTTVVDGAWSCTPTDPLPEGANTITPTATDAAGNSTDGAPIEVTIDTLAPSAPVITGPADGALVADSTPTFNGTGDDGDTVTLTDEGGDVVCTATVVGGAWSCTPTVPLPEGASTITPTATDPAGNTTDGDPIEITVDTEAPTAPVITGPADGAIVPDSTPTFDGTGDDGDTITVTDGDGNVLCTTTVVDGAWSCTPTDPLPEGTNTITPTATDPAGNATPGDPIDVTVDTVAPSAPVITGPADGALVPDSTPTFDGTGDDGDTITVTDGDGNVLCTTTVVDGAWSCTPTEPLPEGTNTITPTATDPAGNTTEGDPIEITVDTEAPTAPVITGPADDAVVDTTTPTFDGTGEDGDTITVTDGDGTVLCTTTIVDGAWSCTPTEPLPEGTNTITPTATDPAGNTTDGDPIEITVDTVAPSAPVITGPADGAVVADSTPTFTGTGDDGDTITLTDGDGNVVCTATVTDGEWSCTPTDPLPEGASTITPTATDAAGNTTGGDPIEITVDTEAPSAPVITGPADGAAVPDSTPTFDGTGDDGDTITVTDGDGTVLCTTTVVDGAWSCTPTEPLPEGTNTITPTATDPAGNTTEGDPIEIIVDTEAPAAPVITGPADGAVVDTATPTFDGTGEDGDTITVTDGDGTVLCTTTVEDGEWSCTPTDPLPEGASTITPTATDAAGNTTAGDPIDLTVDTVAPTPPADLVCAVNPDGTVTCGGSGEPGGTVIIRDDDGDEVCRAPIPASGVFSCTSDGPVDTYPLAVTVEDPAGNESLPAAAPIPPAITGPESGTTTNDTTPEISGTGTSGDTVEVRDPSGAVICSATVDSDGLWSCPPTAPLPEGGSTLIPVAIAEDGGEFAGPPIELVVDTVPPAPVVDPVCIQNPNLTITCSGTGEPGTTVVVTTPDGTELCRTAVVMPEWSCTSSGPADPDEVVITVIDEAGNASAPTVVPVTPYVPQPSDGGGGALGTTGADSSAAIALGILLLLMGGAALLRSRRWALVEGDSSDR